MDERLEYREDMSKVDSAAEKWQIGAPSALSFESGESDYYYSPQDQHIQVIPQKEVSSVRPAMPATWQEVLTYFRCNLSATAKNPSIGIHFLHHNRFVWTHLLTVIFKTIPHTYVNIFLSSYAPNDHFFLAKMVPITYGFTFLYIIAAFFDVLYYVEIATFFLDYAIMALRLKNPWNRCEYVEGILYFNKTVTCYKLPDFINKISKINEVSYNEVVYKDSTEYFNLAHVIYYHVRYYDIKLPIIDGTNFSLAFTYFMMMWLIITIFGHNLLYRRFIWKTLNIIHWVINVIYILVFIHLFVTYLEHRLEKQVDVENEREEEFLEASGFEKRNVDFISESLTAPPILHILPSRINRPNSLSQDSIMIVISSNIFYILKGLLICRVVKYCDKLMKIGLTLSLDSKCFFYIWTVYFATMPLGEIFTVAFLLLHFLMEFSCAAITYQCLVEAIVCEWCNAKRSVVTGVFLVVGLILYYFMTESALNKWYMDSRELAAFFETFGIYLVYPVGRLINDITFHTGTKPNNYRILNLVSVIPYTCARLYMKYTDYGQDDIVVQVDIVMFVLAILGAFYAIYKIICKYQKSCGALFRPDPDWGPIYQVRQLRKLYCSRKYVRSQAPRELTRFMFRRATKAYILDIRYDSMRKSTVPNIGVFVENEMKKNS